MTELFPHFQVIVVSGLHDSGPGHWQTRWQRLHPAFVRVRQDDYAHPDLAAWSARLDQLRRLDARPALLVAHSFGCLTAVHSIARDSAGIAGALLVVPALACPSILVSSANDPWMTAPRAAQWARRWGSELVELGKVGHINAESGLGDWPDGQDYLQRLAELAHNGRLAFSA